MNTVNEIVNNLENKFVRVMEVFSDLGNTVVQETANIGYVYTMIGLTSIGLSLVCGCLAIYFFRNNKNSETREMTIGIPIAIGAIFLIVGFITTMEGTTRWVGPTRFSISDIITDVVR